MKMNPLAALFLTATLTAMSGAALASNTGQANAAANAGQVAPDAKQNIAPNGVDGNNINTQSGNGTKHPTSSAGDMTKDEIHKNTMCKDGKCPDINKKIQTGNGVNNDANTKTDGTSQ